MPVLWLILIVLALAVAGYVAGRARAISGAGDDRRALHSLPSYYGWNVAMKVMVPAFLVLIVWLIAQPFIVNTKATSLLPETAIPEGSTLGLVMSDVRRVADGLDLAVEQGLLSAGEASELSVTGSDIRTTLGSAGVAVGSEISPEILAAAQSYRASNATGNLLRAIVVIGLALLGGALALAQTKPDFRARNSVERGIRAILVGAASLAILTTIGIVLSLVFNTIEFFRIYPAS